MSPAVFGVVVLVIAATSAVVAAIVRRSRRTDNPHVMVSSGDVDALSSWLEQGSPDAPDPSGWTLLMSAAAHDQPDAARRLVAAGADLAATEHQGVGALAVAVTCGHLRVARVLLEAGAPVDRADDLGTSPLHCAVSVRTAGFVPRLLAAGAHPNFRNAFGLTPLDVAEREGLDDVADALRAAGARHGRDVRMRDVLAELSDLDRRAFRIPRAFGLPPDDPALVDAKEAARAALAVAEAAIGDGLVVRLKFVVRERPEHAGESIWGLFRSREGADFVVERLSEPAWVQVPPMVRVSRDDVEDWEVERADGRIDGGFTTRVTLDAVEAQFGYLSEELAVERSRFA